MHIHEGPFTPNAVVPVSKASSHIMCLFWTIIVFCCKWESSWIPLSYRYCITLLQTKCTSILSKWFMFNTLHFAVKSHVPHINIPQTFNQFEQYSQYTLKPVWKNILSELWKGLKKQPIDGFDFPTQPTNLQILDFLVKSVQCMVIDGSLMVRTLARYWPLMNVIVENRLYTIKVTYYLGEPPPPPSPVSIIANTGSRYNYPLCMCLLPIVSFNTYFEFCFS